MSTLAKGGDYMKSHNLYQFTLVLDGVDENTPDLEDKLYCANCDDALINFRNRTVYLDFDREADSLENAIITAIKDVESAFLNAVVTHVAPDELVSEADIAKRLRIKRQAVSLWVKGTRRGAMAFPKPIMKLSEKSPLWRWSDVIKWLYKNEQIKDPQLVDNALLIDNINAVLKERDKKTRQFRQNLLKKLAA